MKQTDGSILKGRWSLKFDKCQRCGRTSVRHMAKGLCMNCYGYHRNVEAVKARRKNKRIENDTVAKRYPKVRAWHVANAEHVAKSKAEWYQANHPPKWPIGKECWVKWEGFWCRGTIVDIQGARKRIVIVQLLGGTMVRTSQKWLEETNPESLEAIQPGSDSRSKRQIMQDAAELGSIGLLRPETRERLLQVRRQA